VFKRPTVFIVGAGASKEFNLPLGYELKEAISDLLNIGFGEGLEDRDGDSLILRELISIAKASGQTDLDGIVQKCWWIRSALPGALSIDNFLEVHKDDKQLVKIGKIAITRAILAAERSSKAFVDSERSYPFQIQDIQGTWLVPFFQILTEGVAKSDIESLFDNISIISFNYDRVIEYILPKMLKIYYGISNSEVSKIFNKLKIIHPYGTVGSILGENSVGFGSDEYSLSKISEKIRTFSEGISDENLQNSIEKCMVNAENIVFLGFSFHKMNMKIISCPGNSFAKKVFATTRGLSPPDVEVIEAEICAALCKTPHRASFLTMEENSVDISSITPMNAGKFINYYFRNISN
jgi:hypothetical protein